MAIKKTGDKTGYSDNQSTNSESVFKDVKSTSQGNDNMNSNNANRPFDQTDSFINVNNDQTWNWNDLQGLTDAFGSFSQSSADIEKIIRSIDSIVNSNDNPRMKGSGITFDFLPIDKNSNVYLEVSALVILVTSSKKPDIAFYKTLLIGSSIEEHPVPEFENINGQQYEKVKLPSEYYNREFKTIVHNQVLARFGSEYSSIASLDGAVISQCTMDDFNQDDEERPMAIIRSIADAANGKYSEVYNPNPINLNTHNNSQEIHSQDVCFSKKNFVDGLGIPYRADIELRTSSSAIAYDSNGRPLPNNRRAVMGLSQATGYIDLLWSPQAPVVSNSFLPQQQAHLNKYYVPELVLTSLKCNKDNTLLGLLFALLNVSFIRENDKWLHTFNPSNDYDDINIHDIGSIGYDIDIQGNGSYNAINTSPDQFNLESLNLLHNLFFVPGLSFALDVPDCGFDTWRYRELVKAANGDNQSITDLFTAAQYLTGNDQSKFMDYYNDLGGSGRPILISPYKPVLGYYKSKVGKRDLRDLDYLAVAKYAGENNAIQYIKEFSNLLVCQIPQAKAINTLQSLLTTILGKVTITGAATRIRFEAAFIEALVKASKHTNYVVNGNHDYNIYQGNQRGIFTNPSSSLVSSSPSGIFNIGNNQGGYIPQGGSKYFR